MPKKQTKPNRKRTWPNVYTRTHRGGQASYVVDLGLVGEKRERHSFKSKGEADTFAELKRTEKANHGATALMLPQALRVEALKAAKILEGSGATLSQAAKYYEVHVLAYRNAPTINEIVNQMILEAGQNERRPQTINELTQRLENFAADFPDARLSEVSLDDLKGWMADMAAANDWSPRSRINYLTKISQLYNFAINHGWVDANLAERIDRPTAEDKEPGIFTVAEAQSLLTQSVGRGLLLYVALGLFGGLRSAELIRLDSSAIKLSDRAIVVGEKIAKKRSRRVVDICDALVAWLGEVEIKKGAIVNSVHLYEQLQALRTAAKIEHWPHNGLRHSFGSYHLAFYGDAVKTATQMGHRDSNIVHNHYKALVLKSDAEKFWNLRPEKK